MRYHYQPDPNKTVGRPSVQGRPIVSANDFDRLGCGVFRTQSRHGKIKNIASDRVYLVLEGAGRFTVADERFEVVTGDVVLVPRNTPYDYEGDLKLFLVHSPANLDEADISLETLPVPDQSPTAPDFILRQQEPIA